MRGEYVVPFLREFVREHIRIVLAVHSSDVAGDSGFQPQHLVEGVAVVEGESAACVRGVRRGELAGRVGIFPADVEDSTVASEVDSLCCGSLVGPRVDRKRDAERGTTLFRDDSDHTAVEVSVFGGRDSGDDFHGFDVVNGYAPGADSGHSGEVGIVTHPDTIDLDGGTEGSITCRGASRTQGQCALCRKVRVDGLPTREQGSYVRHA